MLSYCFTHILTDVYMHIRNHLNFIMVSCSVIHLNSNFISVMFCKSFVIEFEFLISSECSVWQIWQPYIATFQQIHSSSLLHYLMY